MEECRSCGVFRIDVVDFEGGERRVLGFDKDRIVDLSVCSDCAYWLLYGVV